MAQASACAIFVFEEDTLWDNDEKGIAPRALYKGFGFMEEKLMVENDYPVQRFVLRGNL